MSEVGQGESRFGRSNGAMVEKDIEQLMTMGFKRSLAKKALEQGCNHFEVALNMLLGVSFLGRAFPCKTENRFLKLRGKFPMLMMMKKNRKWKKL